MFSPDAASWSEQLWTAPPAAPTIRSAPIVPAPAAEPAWSSKCCRAAFGQVATAGSRPDEPNPAGREPPRGSCGFGPENHSVPDRWVPGEMPVRHPIRDMTRYRSDSTAGAGPAGQTCRPPRGATLPAPRSVRHPGTSPPWCCEPSERCRGSQRSGPVSRSSLLCPASSGPDARPPGIPREPVD